MKKPATVAVSILLVSLGLASAFGQRQGEVVSLPKVLKKSRLGVGATLKSTTLVQGDKETAVLIQTRGRLKPRVYKDHDVILFILSGKGELKMGEEVTQVRPRDLVYIPAGTPHEGFFEEDASILSIFAPQFDPEHPNQESPGPK